MVHKSNIVKAVCFLILLNCLFSSCNYDTEEVIDKTNKIFPNGIRLAVVKKTKETTSRGIFTNHSYGVSHSFTYKFLIKKEKINWDGGSAEPKNILFHKDTIYIRYLKNKYIKTEYIDSIDNTTKYDYHSEICESFQKHVDKRYFFKLLGDDYWVDITPNHYFSVKKFCDEYHIPNDNELSLRTDFKD